MNIAFYCIRFCVISLACGTAFASFRRVLSTIKQEYRFLIGCFSTPVIIPFMDYVLALIWPGVPVVLIKWLPLCCAVCFVAVRSHYRVIGNVVSSLASSSIGGVRNDICDLLKGKGAGKRISGLLCLLYRIAIVVLLIVLMKPVVKLTENYAQYPLYGSDQAHYMLQARYFAEDRKSLEIDNYKGEKDGTVLVDDHGPLWPVYLADALLFDNVENRNAPTVCISQVFTAFLMLASLAAAAGAIMGGYAAWIAIAAALSYKWTLHYPLLGSRDGFRVITLCLFICTVFDFIQRIRNQEKNKGGFKNSDKFTFSDCLFLCAATYLCMNGHGGNAYFIASLAIGMLALLLFHKRFIDSVKLVCSTGIGAGLCLIKNVAMYFRSGSFRSYTSEAYKGTIVEQILANQETTTVQTNTSFFSNYTPEEKRILLLTIAIVVISAVLLVIGGFNTGKNKQNDADAVENRRRFTTVYILIICMCIPFTGLFNFIAGDVQRWFFTQLRYRIVLYLIVGLTCGVSCAFFMRKNGIAKWIARAVAILPFVIAIGAVNNYYPAMPGTYHTEAAVAVFETVADKMREAQTNGYTLCNNQAMSWYLKEPAKLTICKYVKPLYQAETDDEIAAAIEELNLTSFVFTWSGDKNYQLSPFYSYISNSEKYTREVEYYTKAEIEFFVLNE